VTSVNELPTLLLKINVFIVHLDGKLFNFAFYKL